MASAVLPGLAFGGCDVTRNLFNAHDQWRSRPEDERFPSLKAIHNFAKEKRAVARESVVRFKKLAADMEDDNVVLRVGGDILGFTNWSFAQFCNRAGTRHDSVKDLPADLVCDTINFRLDTIGEADDDFDAQRSQLLLSEVGDRLTIRSFHGMGYQRVWDYKVVERIMELGEYGWAVPPAYDKGSFGGEIREGAAGLYCGDRDMFVFMVNDTNRIKRPGSDVGLARGFFIGNSEVGKQSWQLTTFLYDYVCGNHIIWGVKDVEMIKIRHVGEADEKTIAALAQQLNAYGEQSAHELEGFLKKAAEWKLGDDDEEVEDLLYATRVLPRKTIREALDEGHQWSEVFGDPHTAFGMAQAITSLSKQEAYAERRVNLDLASGKVLRMVA
jgi:hypothetical protein